MKKLIFTLCVAATTPFVALQAQNTPNKISGHTGKVIDQNMKAPKAAAGSNKADAIYEWYSYPSFLQDATILGTDGSVMFMAHDSLAKFVDENDTIRYDMPMMGIGSILDPKDDNIDNSSTPELKLTKFTDYSVDSLAFRYLYCRYNDSIDDGQGGKNAVVDTLFIFSFKTPGILERTNSGNGEKVGYTNWDKAKRIPTGYSAIDTVLLTQADTTPLPDASESSWFTGTFVHGFKTPIMVSKVGPGLNNNLVGIVAVYKSGIVYDSSYTFVHQGTGPKPTSDKRINYFGSRSWNDASAVPYVNTAFPNSSMYAPTLTAYPSTQNYYGLQPGSLFTRPAYMDVFYKINAMSTGINDIKNDQFAMGSVYPNPAHSNGTILLDFSVKNTSNVSVAIYNIAGVQVMSALNKNFTAGSHVEEISLNNLKAGIYFVNMTVNGATITKKLTVTE